ncbi:Protein CBG05673 [Caenorhabditis briggsae]|uniref:Protein CBG05673 n=1 Tax=Caenorhabditis briggsae TaxID=6238 RepID=A8X0E8_CAEBR|nr:Protein CBG05673 [Caenorhabditis briggsae]CAP26108.1 Protein CBG05673 [Caenorhabditis briggsae]
MDTILFDSYISVSLSLSIFLLYELKNIGGASEKSEGFRYAFAPHNIWSFRMKNCPFLQAYDISKKFEIEGYFLIFSIIKKMRIFTRKTIVDTIFFFFDDSTAKMRCRLRKQLFIRRNKASSDFRRNRYRGKFPGKKEEKFSCNFIYLFHRRVEYVCANLVSRSQNRKKTQLKKCGRVCDISLFLAVLGLILVIIDSELTALSDSTGVTKASPISVTLRSACVVSTFFLICCLVNYHAIEVKIALIDSGADDWRVAFSTDRFVKMLIEVLVCMICPFPGEFEPGKIYYGFKHNFQKFRFLGTFNKNKHRQTLTEFMKLETDNKVFSDGLMKMPYINADTRHVKMINVPVDVLLSVPMFLRSYLVCRFMVLHSKQFQDAATRSIAALNRISMDFRFVIKTMMADHPLRVLIVFTLSYWMCMSWMFTQCERYDGQLDVEHYYLNSMWFIMVTFMSIGYGDIVPNTYCGRCLSITTGIVGAGVSSALIAIISRKLELSRAEKHVNNFMADSKLTNQRKNAAASVLQETWFIHKYKKALHKGDDLRLRHHQRRFLHSINEFRRIKWDQRKLQEKGNSLLDVGKLHSDMHETLWEMHRTQDHFISQIDVLTQKIMELQMTLNTRPPCCAPANTSSNDAYFSTSTQIGTVLPTVVPAIPLPSQSPMLHASQSHREPLQISTTSPSSNGLQNSASIPRISVGSTSSSTSSGASSGNGSLPQCTVDQLSNCPTGGIYATVTTPLISSFEEV